MRRFAVTTLLLPILSGCATSYQPSGLSGGYEDTRIAENVFRVAFNGNGYTSRERAYDFMLLRAAELCYENNFSYFTLANSAEDSSVMAMQTPTQTYTNTNFNATAYGNQIYGNAYTNQTTYGGQTFYFNKPGAYSTVVCFKKSPDNNPMAFDSRYTYDSIRKKYGILSAKERTAIKPVQHEEPQTWKPSSGGL